MEGMACHLSFFQWQWWHSGGPLSDALGRRSSGIMASLKFYTFQMQNLGLMVACNSSVTFCVVYFYWGFWFEIQNSTELCGWTNVANNMQLFVFPDLGEKEFVSQWLWLLCFYLSFQGFKTSKTVIIKACGQSF